MSEAVRPMRRIPINVAKRIAKDFGYDQVVIYARRVGEEPEPFGEWMTTYGVTKPHCSISARIGYKLKEFMGWEV